ncbi:MAG TPA: peptide ligase PGM1-related protein, partial [Thermoanaerobaculia bacterium]|nr:peptide ligase PGM1-related protein [Thermoanaerobaculia bacterium]
GIDFLARRLSGGADWETYALEINLRMGGTTHPFLALQFLTGGALDLGTGLFRSARGLPKYYASTDNLKSERYRGLCPEDLIDIMTTHRLHYDPTTESGVLFHMIGALSRYGKVGLTAFGNSHSEVDGTYGRAVAALDSETVAPPEDSPSAEQQSSVSDPSRRRKDRPAPDADARVH